MEGIIILIALFVLWMLIAPIVALVKASAAENQAESAAEEIERLRERIRSLEEKQHLGIPQLPPKKEPIDLRVVDELLDEQIELPPLKTPPSPPPLPKPPMWEGDPEQNAEPLPIAEEQETSREAFSLEKFMGVKLFAWLGGVAMFFGVILFVKYAFENNLVSPVTRITLGFLTGSALVGGGLWVHRLPKYKVLAQAFCATGVLILYGVSFAAHAVYDFPAFGSVSTLLLMVVITAGAFLMSVRLHALVVAVLGMLGGFLTPMLLATAQDNTALLFGYIALLDLGLIALSRHANWRFLATAASAGTILTMAGWDLAFFDSGDYGTGNRILIPLGIIIGFSLLFLSGVWLSRRKLDADPLAWLALVAMAAAGMVYAFRILEHPHTGILYGYVLLVNLILLAAVGMRPQGSGVQMLFAVATFLHLCLWSHDSLKESNLVFALGLYLVFGALHSIAPIWLSRRYPESLKQSGMMAGAWLGPFALVLMAWPILNLSQLPLLTWLAVLMVNLMVMGTLRVTQNAKPMLVSVLITMAMAAIWLVKSPGTQTMVPFLWIISGFASLFTLASKFLLDSINSADSPRHNKWMLPAISASLPFLLLWMAMNQVSVPHPAPVFAVALLMSLLLIALGLKAKQGTLFAVALGGSLLVQSVWHQIHFTPFHPDPAAAALWWHIGFYAIFLLTPFVFRKACDGKPLPWITAALSGIGCFLLVMDHVKRSFPELPPGLIPAAFALPSLIALAVLLRSRSQSDSHDQSWLAWFGGVALLFVTLIFPIQLERQWLTVAWALEGAALLWLFRKVPHPGLQWTGLTLLATTFVRLSLNTAVFMDYPRSGTAIFNWHLYVYGTVAAAHFVAARWFSDPEDQLRELHPRAFLAGCGTVLIFLLLNIEIADYFTAPGATFITFEFGGNFARDMTYSIAWGLFSLALLGIGIWKRQGPLRYAAVALLAVTLIKLFLFDLATIGSIYRIGALVGVALIAFVASFLYQRFFDRTKDG